MPTANTEAARTAPEVFADRLSRLTLCAPQQYGALTIFPLMAEDTGPAYLMLADALAQNLLTISEVSEGGSVPDLKVESRADLPILLIDGEELAGAKQNRAVNTSILLKERATMTIPVSCTEQGRWSYRSREFSSSGKVISKHVRMAKTRSVNRSVREEASYRSDQAEVWHRIGEEHATVGSASPTHALYDAVAEIQPELDRITASLPEPSPGQCGILALVGGKPAGLDLFSRASAYASAHRKILESYAMDATLRPGVTDPNADPAVTARAFLSALVEASKVATVHPSLGYGEDLRFESASVAGMALVHAGAVIHAAAFGLDEPEPATSSSGSTASTRRLSLRDRLSRFMNR